MTKKQVIKTIAFLLIFAVLFTTVSSVMRAKWAEANSEDLVVDEFNNLIEKDTLEMLFLGSSQMTYGINPYQVYEDYGVSSYSISSGNMCPLIQYYWLLDAFKVQNNVKTLVFDTSMLFEPEGETRYRRALNSMNWSINKLKAIWAHGQDELAEDGMELYLFDFLRYHSRWDELTEMDFKYWTSEFNFFRGTRMTGYVWTPTMPYSDFVVDNDPDDDPEVELNTLQFDYFERILGLCEERGINVILVKTPKESWTKEGSIFVEKYAKENNYPFLDFSYDEGFRELGLDYYGDFKDKDHLNVRGATKFTTYLMDYIMETGVEYTDYRKVEGFSLEKPELYKIDRVEKMLRSCISIDEFLTYLDNEEFEIVIQSTDDISKLWTAEYQKAFSDAGIKLDISKMSGKNYVIVMSKGKCVYEKSSADTIYYSGMFEGNDAFETASNIYESEDDAYMKVKNVERPFEVNGMNILVRSVYTSKIIAKYTIYNDGGKLAYANIGLG